MKKISLFFALFFLGALAIWSCSDLDKLPNIMHHDSQTIENAKRWYDDQVKISQNNARTLDTLKDKHKLKPEWEKSKKHKLNKEYDILVVEAESPNIQNPDLSIVRVFIFKEKGSKIVDGRIVEIIGQKSFLKENAERVAADHRKTKIEGFNGAIIGYDIEYAYLDGYTFKDGIRQNAQAIITNRKEGAGVSDPTKGRVLSSLRTNDEDEPGCYNQYWDTYTYGCNCWSTMYIGSYCIPGSGSGGSGEGGSGGTPAGGGGTPPTNGAPNLMSVAATITTPCFTAVWDLIKNANFNNVIQGILYEFNKSKSLQFILAEHNSIGVQKAATTTINSNGVPVVSLNKWALRNASKEAVTQTIYHEVLHVMLQGVADAVAHPIFANHYIDPLKQAIWAWYPSMSDSAATALAWTGLQHTDAYQSLGAGTKAWIGQYSYRYFWSAESNKTPYGNACP